ncbi:16S rRNA (cytidine(1402)-2'-O)-methyltransferase [Symbiobacterium thermophilum]|uniref:Ribosomal RNA small subunit methyltransferase I n=1 Tax=Symbiobacterium thermophilum TaxID=2734 RepID=A0A1Y2T716_SYMTR|nr:16S rRNA (cytidine(1402)-2'-O)-methyltransferase [Symbiobacterium thermophilum]MBY6276673.1 16S rRNA (cytidine(1402)-2'-O)-methyltransferase [Symbiobacterium thermophilum]OTA42198.1 MAG: rRNA (cytidine-2'-O-)-methyltransferase [Symbiobacterium thermophilum]
MAGTLYIVGTPIGNLEDVTHRALRILRSVSVIACEDTRETRKLLQHFQIDTPTTSYHEHNKRKAGPALIRRLLDGEDVALVSDAGMPAISDPGEELVRSALDAGIPVVPVPGPTALVTALVASGLPTGRFAFEGFLPHKGRERRRALERLKDEERTLILYEAPHRLLETLHDLRETLGDRPMTAARELTKLHEEYVRGTVSQVIDHFNRNAPRGEFVLVVQGAEAEAPVAGAPDPALLAGEVAAFVAQGMDRKLAMKEVAQRFGVSRKAVYQALLDAKDEK